MFFFSHSETPAVRAHLNSQTAFLNDMSKSLSRSFQEICQLNIQLGQTMLEESTLIGQQLLTTERPTDIIPRYRRSRSPSIGKVARLSAAPVAGNRRFAGRNRQSR